MNTRNLIDPEKAPGDFAPPALPPFRPRLPWIGGDLQTVRNYLVPGIADLAPWPERRLSFSAPDNGDRLLAALHTPSAPSDKPLVVLVHGLTGCEGSFYVLETARYLLTCGYPVLRVNLRGAGPSRAGCTGSYCAGSGADIGLVLAGLDDTLTARGVVLVGYSLGGVIMLNHLTQRDLPVSLVCAVTVSAPLDLAAAARRMMSPRNTIYHRWLLSRMKAEATSGLAHVTDAEQAAIRSARSVYAFDDRFVAPRNGFADAEDYYMRCSPGGWLDKIATPLLLIHGRDDPWIPAKPYEAIAGLSLPGVEVELAEGGGHVGFHGRGDSTPWHNVRLHRFIDQVSAQNDVA